MRVLITNLYLANYSGSEVVVEMLADGLRRAGHAPMVLAPGLGPQAWRMRERGHVVVDRIAALPARPDVMHLQHTPVALTALAAFPETPAVFACHSAQFEVEAPRPHPQIRRFVAVDDLCRQRCLSRGVPEERLEVILNAVDLARFVQRPPLPVRPKRALLLTKNHAHIEAVRAACAEYGIELDELGAAVGRVSDKIEQELLAYDLVFATARMAIEAAAVGCAVIVCDARGFAGLLTSDKLGAWRKLNFGAGLLTRPTTIEALRGALAAYDSGDAARVTTRLRAEESVDGWAARHLALYQRAMEETSSPSAQECALATAMWAEDFAPSAGDRSWRTIAREIFLFEAEPTAAALAQLEARLATEFAHKAEPPADALVQMEARLTAEFTRHTGELAGQIARVEAAQRPSAPLRGLWRALVPHAVRAPLFQLRQRLLGRPPVA